MRNEVHDSAGSDPKGGSRVRQTALAEAASRSAAAAPASQSASYSTFPAPGKILLTDDEGAATLGVSSRRFAQLMHEPWFPRPVILGPRLKRHVRAELEAAVASMPRQEAPGNEPAQLQRGREQLRGRIERAKKTGSLA